MSKTCENCIHFCVCVYRDGTQINASLCAFYDQNKRPHGEWEIYFNSSGTLMRKCTRCGHEFNQNSDAQNFCPNCGASMRKEGEAE